MKASQELLHVGIGNPWSQRPEEAENYKKQIEIEYKIALRNMSLALAMQLREGDSNCLIDRIIDDAKKIAAYLAADSENTYYD